MAPSRLDAGTYSPNAIKERGRFSYITTTGFLRERFSFKGVLPPLSPWSVAKIIIPPHGVLLLIFSETVFGPLATTLLTILSTLLKHCLKPIPYYEVRKLATICFFVATYTVNRSLSFRILPPPFSNNSYPKLNNSLSRSIS